MREATCLRVGDTCLKGEVTARGYERCLTEGKHLPEVMESGEGGGGMGATCLRGREGGTTFLRGCPWLRGIHLCVGDGLPERWWLPF